MSWLASCCHLDSEIKYLLLTEFEGRTVNYGPRFSPSIYGPSAKCAGHKSKGKNKGPKITVRAEKRGY